MKKVMIVDDDLEFLKETAELLKNSGYDTLALSSGEEALARALEEKPDVIILDLKMKGKGGFETAANLKRSAKTADIPLIAVTGVYIEKEHHAIIRACNFDSRLTKPVNPLDMIAAIEQAVGE